MQYGISVLLIIHSILAVLLLGAITHQAIAAAWPATKRAPGFFNSLRSVNGMSYTNAIIVLFLVTFVFGTIIYPTYRLSVRTVLQEYHLYKPEGMFELKEHLLALSLALLPLYWLLWRRRLPTIELLERRSPPSLRSLYSGASSRDTSSTTSGDLGHDEERSE